MAAKNKVSPAYSVTESKAVGASHGLGSKQAASTSTSTSGGGGGGVVKGFSEHIGHQNLQDSGRTWTQTLFSDRTMARKKNKGNKGAAESGGWREGCSSERKEPQLERPRQASFVYVLSYPEFKTMVVYVFFTAAAGAV